MGAWVKKQSEKPLCNWNVPVVYRHIGRRRRRRNGKSIMPTIKLSPFSGYWGRGARFGKGKKKWLPVRCVCILRSSIYLRSKNKEIAASLLPWAWRNKQSIFAPRDPRKDVHINHPACTCPKNQPQSPVSSRLGSRCHWGSPSSSNRCARGHSEPRWHRCCQRRKMEITFPSFPILLPKQPVYMHFRAPLIRFANDWPHTGSLSAGEFYFFVPPRVKQDGCNLMLLLITTYYAYFSSNPE